MFHALQDTGLVLIFTRVRKHGDIFEIIEKSDIFDIDTVFAHTFLKHKIYYQIVVCVYVLCILSEVLSSFTLHYCG